MLPFGLLGLTIFSVIRTEVLCKMFNYRTLQWFCPCGRKAGKVEVGITSDFKLFATWACSCGRDVKAVETFEDLCANAPPHPVSFNKSDESFLAKARVKWE